MITYLSSLYDVFPEPPQMHPLFDMESQRRVQEYRELAQQLLYWCREKTSFLQERTFGTTLIELKRLMSDMNKFRNEEMPPKHRDKQRLFTVFKELEVSILLVALLNYKLLTYYFNFCSDISNRPVRLTSKLTCVQIPWKKHGIVY